MGEKQSKIFNPAHFIFIGCVVRFYGLWTNVSFPNTILHEIGARHHKVRSPSKSHEIQSRPTIESDDT